MKVQACPHASSQPVGMRLSVLPLGIALPIGHVLVLCAFKLWARLTRPSSVDQGKRARRRPCSGCQQRACLVANLQTRAVPVLVVVLFGVSSQGCSAVHFLVKSSVALFLFLHPLAVRPASASARSQADVGDVPRPDSSLKLEFVPFPAWLAGLPQHPQARANDWDKKALAAHPSILCPPFQSDTSRQSLQGSVLGKELPH